MGRPVQSAHQRLRRSVADGGRSDRSVMANLNVRRGLHNNEWYSNIRERLEGTFIIVAIDRAGREFFHLHAPTVPAGKQERRRSSTADRAAVTAVVMGVASGSFSCKVGLGPQGHRTRR